MKFPTFNLQIPKPDSQVHQVENQTFPESILSKQRANCNWTLLKTCPIPKPWGQMPPKLNSNYFKKFTKTLVYNIEYENNHSMAQFTYLSNLSRKQ
jgi:hypothetical protein